MQTVVTPNHPSAPAVATATRNMLADFGVGTLHREDPNMLRSRQVAISLAGYTQPKWGQSKAVEFRTGVLPKSRAMDVVARSGNQANLASIGLADEGSTQVGAGTPAPAEVPFLSFQNPTFRTLAFSFGIYMFITKVAGPKLFGHMR